MKKVGEISMCTKQRLTILESKLEEIYNNYWETSKRKPDNKWDKFEVDKR